MVLIGMTGGEFQGTKWAKAIFTEPFDRQGSAGMNVVVSRMDYECYRKILPDAELYIGNTVSASYNRFGKVTEITLS